MGWRGLSSKHAKLPLNEADGLVKALFCQAHPTEVDRKILDPGMLRVATSLFNDPVCAQHLSSFTRLGVDDQKRELLKMAAELETNPSPEARRMFSLSMLAHVRTLPPELRGKALCHPDTGKPTTRCGTRGGSPCAPPIRRRAGLCCANSWRSRSRSTAPWTRRALSRTRRAISRRWRRIWRWCPSPRDSFATRICTRPTSRSRSSGILNRLPYRSSLVLCRLPEYGLRCPGRLRRSGNLQPEEWQTFAVQGRSEREKDDGGAARDGQ